MDFLTTFTIDSFVHRCFWDFGIYLTIDLIFLFRLSYVQTEETLTDGTLKKSTRYLVEYCPVNNPTYNDNILDQAAYDSDDDDAVDSGFHVDQNQ